MLCTLNTIDKLNIGARSTEYIRSIGSQSRASRGVPHHRYPAPPTAPANMEAVMSDISLLERLTLWGERRQAIECVGSNQRKWLEGQQKQAGTWTTR